MLENPRTRAVVFFILAGTVGSSLGLAGMHIGFIETVERKSYDWRSSNLRTEVSKPTAALVLVDETSLAFFKNAEQVGWPLPRDMYCPVITWLARAGAKVTAFDILYSEPSEFDSVFADCIQEAGNVVIAFQCHQGGRDPAPPPSWSFPVTVSDGVDMGHTCQYSLPAANRDEELTLRNTPYGGAIVSVEPDTDGVLRHMTPFRKGGHGYHPVLGLGAYLSSLPRGVTPVIAHYGDRLDIDGRTIPLDENGQVVVRFRPNWPPFPIYSFSQIYAAARMEEEGLKSPLDPALFKDKVIFLGTSAAGTYEFRVTPVREADYGIHLHASLYEAIVSGDHNRRANRSTNMLLIVLAAFLIAATSTRPKKISTQLLLSLLVFIGYIGACLLAFEHDGLWLDLVAPVSAMAAAFSAAAVSNYLTEGRAKKQIRGAFSMYLSPVVIESLVEDPSKLKLGGERRQITAFFSDVQGFTTFSEGMEPPELVAFLNAYLTEMTEIVLAEGGTIDKYEGDAIIAMFGAPLPQADHAVRACVAALRCQQRLAELRPQWVQEGLPECHMRIGVNSGDAVVGNMGSTQRFDYTMIGDTVNLAARLEGTNKVYNMFTMVGEVTHKLAGGALLMREVDAVRVKGKTQPISIFEPICLNEQASPSDKELVKSWTAALQLYRAQKFDAARDAFTAHRRQFPQDHAATEFIQRCDVFSHVPPDQPWDGVYEMKTK